MKLKLMAEPSSYRPMEHRPNVPTVEPEKDLLGHIIKNGSARNAEHFLEFIKRVVISISILLLIILHSKMATQGNQIIATVVVEKSMSKAGDDGLENYETS